MTQTESLLEKGVKTADLTEDELVFLLTCGDGEAVFARRTLSESATSAMTFICAD